MSKNRLAVFKERGFLFICGAVFWVQTDYTYSQEKSLAEIDSLLNLAVVATITQNYSQSEALIAQAIARSPQDPFGHLFHAAMLQSRMLDYEDYSDEKEFFKSLKTCRNLAQKSLQRQPNDARLHFLLGSAYGYESFYAGKKQRYLEAVHTGWKCIQHLETAIRLDSTFYDAYLGIGTYKYYRSKLKLAFFFSDERAEGLAMVRKAATQGKYARYAAINGLTWMLLDENRAAEALTLTDSILVQYPHSRFFLWGAAAAANQLGDHERARNAYHRIMASLREQGRLSPYLEAVCRTKLAKTQFNSGSREQGCAEVALIAQLELSKAPRRKEIEKQLKHLQENCQGTMSNGHTGNE